MRPHVAQVLVAAVALGVAASAAGVLALGSATGSLFAYRSEGRADKAAHAVARTALLEREPIVLPETIIVAERPGARQAIEPPVESTTVCGAWRRTHAGPRARATGTSEVRPCESWERAIEQPTPPMAPVAPRTSRPTMEFDYALDAPGGGH